MTEHDRRSFLTVVTGSVAALSGCTGFIESDQVDAPEPDVTPEENTAQTITDAATETEPDPTLGSISVEKRRDLDDNPRNMWGVVNNSPATLQMATVRRLVPAEDEDISLRQKAYYTFAVSPGDAREFQSQSDADTELIESATWFDNQNTSPQEQADVTSSPRSIIPIDGPDAWFPEPAKLTYVVPNETGIASEDVREVTLNGTALEQEGDSFVFTSSDPVWGRIYEVTVDSTTTSETFTWRASSPPQIDIDVGGSLGNLDITVTAQSETPLVNAMLYIVPKGANVADNGRFRPKYVSRARVGDDPQTSALITNTVGDERVGQSRTITVDYDVRVNYPVDETEDRLIVGVAAAQSGVGYPVANVEVPIIEITE